MTERIEGTVILDGLIEGRLPDDPDFESKLRQWVQLADSLGARFSLDLGGGTFSLLPDQGPFATSKFGGAPDDGLRQALEQLVSAFPEELRGGVFSTLRSSEFRPGEEVQTLYLVQNTGTVQAKTRIVDTRTSPAKRPLSGKNKVKRGALGALGAVALLGVLSLFIDLRSLVGDFVDTLRPLGSEKVSVDTAAFSGFLTVDGVRVDSNRRKLVLMLKRLEGYPVGEEQLEQVWEATAGPAALKHRLALEAIAQGYLRAELFDAKGAFLEVNTLRIRDLNQTAGIEAAVSLPRRGRVAKVILTF